MRGRRKRPPLLPADRPLSAADSIYLGEDEAGNPVFTRLAGRSIILAGLPNSGKSAAAQICISHLMLSHDLAEAWFFDAKQVELGMWAPAATEFVGPDMDRALSILRALQGEIDAWYAEMLLTGSRKVAEGGVYRLLVVDELAAFTSVYGDGNQQKEFARLLRDIVARGRAIGIIVILATQRPSSEIVPTALRDLVPYRAAFSCVNDASSDVILGDGWANEGYSAASIAASDEMSGVCWLRHESSIPRKLRWSYLPDRDLQSIVVTAAALRAERLAA